jgi:hypothetical protein
MAPDGPWDLPKTAIPGLGQVTTEAEAGLEHLFGIIEEGRACRAALNRGLTRIRDLQDRAKAGEVVDLIEFQTTRIEVERNEARLGSLAAAAEAALAEVEKVPGRLNAVVRKALNRRALIARAETLPGGRA